jgi:PTS system mannose-specific IIA component
MVGLLVVTHGQLANELAKAVTRVVGEVEALEAVSIGWDDEPSDASRRIDEAIRRVDRGQGVLLLTDMFGGTPTNLALSLHDTGSIEIVTGVNLPMLIKFTNLRQDQDLHATASQIAEDGRAAIQVASHLLDAEQSPEAS